MDHCYDVKSPELVCSEEEQLFHSEDDVEHFLVRDTDSQDFDAEYHHQVLVGKQVRIPCHAENFYIKLINLVRGHPCIYDKFDGNFKNPPAREKAWNDIAAELKISVHFAQNRWLRLRERFSREKRAIESMNKSEASASKKKVWPFFLPLLFLNSHIKPRHGACRMKLNVDDSYPPTSDEVSNMTVSDFVEEMEDKVEVLEDDKVNMLPASEVSISAAPVKKLKTETVKAEDKTDNQTRIPSVTKGLPRKIVAKEEKPAPSLLPVQVGKDKDNGFNKLPPGVVIIKGQNQLNGNPLMLVSTSTPSGAKPGTVPFILSSQVPAAAQAPSSSASAPSPNSAEHHFGMLIAKELERLPKEIRSKKKQKILMVLYE